MSTFQPCLLSWVGGDPTAADLASVRAAVRRSGRGRMLSIDRRRHLLLMAEADDRRHVREAIAGAVRDPGARIQLVVGREQVEAVVPRLLRSHSLACLLERLDRRAATAFVDEQLAALAAHDREHGTNLLRVLELALDHPDRSAAARAAYMHRNTFRRQLRTALELIDADLDRPEERLALHLALKMRSRLRSAS